jgi:hypothetical protein
MSNEASKKRTRTFLVLEIAFIGFLGWIVLPSAGGGQKLSQPEIAPDRFVPQEGPTPPELAVQIGTPNACQGFDFAGGSSQGFTVQPLEGTPLVNLWHLTNGFCRASLAGHSIPYTFYYGQDLSCNYNTGARNGGNLVSPPISLVGIFPPYSIGFNYLLFVESGGFDAAFVDLSTDNGATWTQFLSKANLIDDNQWHNVSANVTAAVGAATSIRLRFRFDTIDSIANSTTGWHVDDVLVCGQPFNFCVQDDVTNDFIQFNSVTGVYVTRQCSTGFTAQGVGTVTTNGSIITLQQFSNGLFNTATVNTSTNTGSATIRAVNGLSIVAYNISDTNILNNTCACP